MAGQERLRSIVSLMRDIDELFDRHFGNVHAGPSVWEPPIDLFVDEKSLHLFAEVPGTSIEDLEIRAGRQMVVISGCKRGGRHVGPGVRFYESEIAYGAFRKQVRLPVPVDPASFTIELENGILSLEFARGTARTTIIPVE